MANHSSTAVTVDALAQFTGMVGGRWKIGILYSLGCDGKARFNQLAERMSPVTPTTLTRQLRELERDGLVTRTQYNEIPPRVEYDITDTAHTLIPVLEHIATWTTSHGKTLVASGTQS